jgi:dTDP-4-dehydrorhamnose 3,5-epimerase-like enzyme
LNFPHFETKGSSLTVYESGSRVPFPVKRVFTVQASEECVRGFHAHRKCAQLLVVLNGECLVTCDDGKMKKMYPLNKPFEGLLIPPTIWAEQKYAPNTTLMVLTDQFYDEEDYIRDYNLFLEFRGVL